MTVGELIIALQRLQPDLTVAFFVDEQNYSNGYYTPDEVESTGIGQSDHPLAKWDSEGRSYTLPADTPGIWAAGRMISVALLKY